MKTDVYLFISENYDLIKKTLKRELRNNRNLNFDEDIFHDTILRCMEKYSDVKFENEEEFIAYIIVSFKTNLKRDKLYAVNSKRYDGELEDYASEIKDNNNNKQNIDVNIILEEINNKFGEDVKNKTYDWLICQMTISEINKKYNCKNSRYIIDKIKEYIKQTYSINDFR
ncbi:MAG: sigma-70 family RNA polymerase sigma factor [Bacilli bacterium]|nr:sigma-70 family RNA polymerase sigma factor [Bacilli bacterium]